MREYIYEGGGFLLRVSISLNMNIRYIFLVFFNIVFCLFFVIIFRI